MCKGDPVVEAGAECENSAIPPFSIEMGALPGPRGMICTGEYSDLICTIEAGSMPPTPPFDFMGWYKFSAGRGN